MIGLVVVLVLVLGLVVTAARWATARHQDERSIETHRSTLGVIEHAAGADEQPEQRRGHSTAHVRIVGGPAAVPRPADDMAVWRPSDRRSRRPSFPSPKEHTLRPPDVPVAPAHPATVNRDVARLLATQARRAATPAPAASDFTPATETKSAPRPETAARRAGSRWVTLPSAGPHLPVVLASVAAALVMAAVIGVALDTRRGGGSRPPASAASPAPHRSTGPALSPSTVAPPAPAVVATSADSSNAVYTVNATALNVQLVAAGPCWVELRDGSSSGSVVFEGTLRSGVSQIFHAAGTIWLRLGDPAGIRMTIDGSAVALPASASPFDVTVTSPTGA